MAEAAVKEQLTLLTRGIAQQSSTDGVSSMSERKRNRLQELERRRRSSKNSNNATVASCSSPASRVSSSTHISSLKQSTSMAEVEQLDLAKGNAGQSKTDGVSSVSERKRNRLQELERRHTSCKASDNTTATSSCPTASTAKREPPSRPTSQNQPNGDFQGPVYAKLAQVVLDGPISSHLQLSAEENNTATVDSIIRELVHENGKAVRDLDSVLGAKVQDRILQLDNPAGHGKAVEKARKRATKSLAKRSKKHLSKHQQRMKGSFDIPSCYHKFDIFLPMHEMWKAYTKKVFKENSGKIPGPWFIGLDLHGAYLAIVQAKIKNQVGVEGIMIRETTNTFAIVTKTDRIKVIPKTGSVFVFRMDNMMITWFGDNRIRHL